ncbi:MAG: hypothetical protein ACR2OA_09140 [Rubripirellula sp.]
MTIKKNGRAVVEDRQGASNGASAASGNGDGRVKRLPGESRSNSSSAELPMRPW